MKVLDDQDDNYIHNRGYSFTQNNKYYYYEEKYKRHN